MAYATDLTTLVNEYLGSDHSWTPTQILNAIDAEESAQARAVTFPADPDPLADPDGSEGRYYTPDLAEALCRRVARNLAMRALPLAVQMSNTDLGPVATRMGSTDPEVRRLEAPYRRLVVG